MRMTREVAKFYVHSKVGEKSQGDINHVSQGEKATSSTTQNVFCVGVCGENNASEMGTHSKFEIREKKTTKIGRDIIEYEVITDEEDDVRYNEVKLENKYTSGDSVGYHRKSGTLESVSEERVESESSIGGAIQERASRELGEVRSEYSSVRGSARQYQGHYGASGPGSRDVGVQMQTTYIIPRESYKSRRRDVATQTRLQRSLSLRNPRVLSDYQTERFRLLNSSEQFFFDKEKRDLYRVTTKKRVVESESDTYSTITEESDASTITESFRSEDVTRSKYIHTTGSYGSEIEEELPRSDLYCSDQGPSPDTRNVGVQMSTRYIVQREGLAPVKVRDIMVQTKPLAPHHFSTDSSRPYSKMIERIWKNKVPFNPKKPVSPSEASILRTIDVDPYNERSQYVLPMPPTSSTPTSTPRRKSRRPSRSKSMSLTLSSPRLVPYITEADATPTYSARVDVGVATDTDLEVVETDPPRHYERSSLQHDEGSRRISENEVNLSTVVKGVHVTSAEENSVEKDIQVTRDKTPTPELRDTPSPVQSVEITYLDKENSGGGVKRRDSVKEVASYKYVMEDINSEPVVLQPEVTEENREYLELIQTPPLRRRKLKRGTKVYVTQQISKEMILFLIVFRPRMKSCVPV